MYGTKRRRPIGRRIKNVEESVWKKGEDWNRAAVGRQKKIEKLKMTFPVGRGS